MIIAGKMKFSLLFRVVSFACSIRAAFCQFKVQDEGCGVTKTCKYFPDGCNINPDPAIPCRLVTWKKAESLANDSKIEIELRSAPNAQYIAIGFGRSNLMQDADVYYCTDKNGFETAAITTRHSAPEDMPQENGLSHSGLAVVNSEVHCRFIRPMSVSKLDSTGKYYTYDLNAESFYILLAEGPLADAGSLNYHTWRIASSSPVFFPENFNTSVLEPPTVSTNSVPKVQTSGKPSPQPIAATTATIPPQAQTTKSPVEETTSGAISNHKYVWSICGVCMTYLAFVRVI